MALSKPAPRPLSPGLLRQRLQECQLPGEQSIGFADTPHQKRALFQKQYESFCNAPAAVQQASIRVWRSLAEYPEIEQHYQHARKVVDRLITAAARCARVAVFDVRVLVESCAGIAVFAVDKAGAIEPIRNVDRTIAASRQSWCEIAAALSALPPAARAAVISACLFGGMHWPEGSTVKEVPTAPRRILPEQLADWRFPELKTMKSLQGMVQQYPPLIDEHERSAVIKRRFQRYAREPLALMGWLYCARTHAGMTQEAVVQAVRGEMPSSHLTRNEYAATEWGAVVPTAAVAEALGKIVGLPPMLTRSCIQHTAPRQVAPSLVAELLDSGTEYAGLLDVSRMRDWPSHETVAAIRHDFPEMEMHLAQQLNAKFAPGIDLSVSPAYRGYPFFIEGRDVAKIHAALADATGYLAAVVFARNYVTQKSAKNAAVQCGIESARYNKIENGKMRPHDRELSAIAAAYNLPVGQLIVLRERFFAKL